MRFWLLEKRVVVAFLRINSWWIPPIEVRKKLGTKGNYQNIYQNAYQNVYQNIT
ncbi:MAG: hypothetical protein HC916_06845 [Coleofasciculaceae cyanobacterium SM2_1_6]|nr:hypothetical protein [Coleofasciculaceae cyanobacterium SM2_1_6]